MIENLKKIELHLHLDGSVRVSTIEELLDKNNLEKELVVDENTKSLTDYLKKFDLPIKVMQSKENLIRISKELCEDLIKDNVIYAEIRFAPNFHTKEGLSLDEVVSSVLLGLDSKNIKTNLILCMMRGDSYENNKNIIDLAIKYRNKGVCGIDLAGDEAKYPTSLYKDLFSYALENNLNITVHAGEAGTSKEVKDAISYGAKRIGHGIKIINDDEAINLVKEKQIPLEICPTSNVQTCNVDNIMNHPIKKLFDKGILVTINTDNRTVSNTSLNKEYKLLEEYLNFTKEDFIKTSLIAIDKAFLTNEEKQELRKIINKNIKS